MVCTARGLHKIEEDLVAGVDALADWGLYEIDSFLDKYARFDEYVRLNDQRDPPCRTK